MRCLLIFVILFFVSCAAGTHIKAPIYRYGVYLMQCDYIKNAVCCNYSNRENFCSSRWCAGTWMNDWEKVWEYCPGYGLVEPKEVEGENRL